jgi:tetratricopeptide (TPR) repeat protein
MKINSRGKMTNRQSNIIFYSIISIIIYAIIINFTHPDFFVDLSKSKEEISIKEAMNNEEYMQALVIYQQLVQKKLSDDSENSVELAIIYEDMASLHSLLGHNAEEKKYYLKSLAIKNKLKSNDMFGFAKTYYKLGLIAEEERQFDQAQMYYEQSLLKRLGDTKKVDEQDQGIITGMHQSRLSYIRLNNEATIATFIKLAIIHSIKEDDDVAKKYYLKALAASKITFGEEANQTLAIMESIKQLSP